MDSSHRAALDNIRRLRRAVEALRDGHAMGIQFLKDEGIEWPAGIPMSLGESLALGEAVAEAALNIGAGPKEVEFRLLMAMLIRFGKHMDDCRCNIGNVDGPCTCCWSPILAWAESELPDGPEREYCMAQFCDDRHWGEEAKP